MEEIIVILSIAIIIIFIVVVVSVVPVMIVMSISIRILKEKEAECERVKAQRNEMAVTLKEMSQKAYKQKLKIRTLSADLYTMCMENSTEKQFKLKMKWRGIYLQDAITKFKEKEAEDAAKRNELIYTKSRRSGQGPKITFRGVGSQTGKDPFKEMLRMDERAHTPNVNWGGNIHDATNPSFKTNPEETPQRNPLGGNTFCQCTIPSFQYGIAASPNCNKCNKPPKINS